MVERKTLVEVGVDEIDTVVKRGLKIFKKFMARPGPFSSIAIFEYYGPGCFHTVLAVFSHLH